MGDRSTPSNRLLAAIYPSRLESFLIDIGMRLYRYAEAHAGFVPDPTGEDDAIENARMHGPWPLRSTVADAVADRLCGTATHLEGRRGRAGRWMGEGTWYRGRQV